MNSAQADGTIMDTCDLVIALHDQSVCTEDYVEWAIARLVEDADTPELRILAGLQQPLDPREVERLFKKIASDLRLPLDDLESCYYRKLEAVIGSYKNGALADSEFVSIMYDYRMTLCTEKVAALRELLTPWLMVYYSKDEEFWNRPFIPLREPELTSSINRELHLFQVLSRADLPRRFMDLAYCRDCGSLGLPETYQSLKLRLFRFFKTSRGSGRCFVCAICKSLALLSMQTTEARERYVLEQKLS